MKILLIISLIISLIIFTGCTKNFTWEYDAINDKLHIDRTDNLPDPYRKPI